MFEFERFDGPYTCEEIIEHHKYISVSDREIWMQDLINR
jgi:hypothetical protein